MTKRACQHLSLVSFSRSDKKILHQMSDLLKRKHQLRLIELEESVLLAQVNRQV